MEAFAAAGVPCGPILDMAEVFNDPQVKTLNMSPSVNHPRLGTLNVVGQAVKLERTPQRMHSATPDLGQHTLAILNEIGIEKDEFDNLRENGVV